ncbi:unnamed protein product, partial [Porites evermanni]
MTGDLNMDNHKIRNLNDEPTSGIDGINKNYVDSVVSHSHVKPSHQKDQLSYLMSNVLQWTDLIDGGNSFNTAKIADLSNFQDKSLSESDIKTLKDFYKHYYKKYWCFKKSYKRSKHLGETIIISGICLMIIGTITGGITLNPVIPFVVNRAGILVTNFGKMKNCKKKIEMTEIAF